MSISQILKDRFKIGHLLKLLTILISILIFTRYVTFIKINLKLV